MIRTLTPEDVAEAIVRAIERERRLVVTPLLLRLLLGQVRFFPRLAERILIGTGKLRPQATRS